MQFSSVAAAAAAAAAAGRLAVLLAPLLDHTGHLRGAGAEKGCQLFCRRRAIRLGHRVDLAHRALDAGAAEHCILLRPLGATLLGWAARAQRPTLLLSLIHI